MISMPSGLLVEFVPVTTLPPEKNASAGADKALVVAGSNVGGVALALNLFTICAKPYSATASAPLRASSQEALRILSRRSLSDQRIKEPARMNITHVNIITVTKAEPRRAAEEEERGK